MMEGHKSQCTSEGQKNVCRIGTFLYVDSRDQTWVARLEWHVLLPAKQVMEVSKHGFYWALSWSLLLYSMGTV